MTDICAASSASRDLRTHGPDGSLWGPSHNRYRPLHVVVRGPTRYGIRVQVRPDLGDYHPCGADAFWPKENHIEGPWCACEELKEHGMCSHVVAARIYRHGSPCIRRLPWSRARTTASRATTQRPRLERMTQTVCPGDRPEKGTAPAFNN